MKTLKDLFLEELADMYDAEHRIVKALPDLIEAATCSELKSALQSHLQETEGQVQKLERVFASFKETPKRVKCPAMVGLLDEGDDMVKQNKKSPSINAAIISAGQKVEHYEIASYGCLQAWAGLLGNHEAALDLFSSKFWMKKKPPTKPLTNCRLPRTRRLSKKPSGAEWNRWFPKRHFSTTGQD